MEASVVRRGAYLPGLTAASSKGSTYTVQKHVGTLGIRAEKAELQQSSTPVSLIAMGMVKCQLTTLV